MRIGQYIIYFFVWSFFTYGVRTSISDIISFLKKRRDKRIQEVEDALDGKTKTSINMNRQSPTMLTGGASITGITTNVSGSNVYTVGPFSTKGPVSNP
jgi:hypothetical protein